ncbi:MAG: alpha/beta hydrolase [Actinomycetota bacterium]|nr:alpha/beta hydrolase [Actinomycetota bacterium]
MQVPLDYSAPNGGKISIALIRLPAGDPARRIGSLFLNPGGPGGSGVDFVHALGPILLTAQVRARFDLVGFDPRGVVRSTALRCFENLDQLRPLFLEFAFPTNRVQELIWESADRYLAGSCVRRAGPIVSHMSTANAARDLDRLRAAVGDRQLNYYGVSYGSYLGATYANLFPTRVRALAVDGVLDPVAWSTGNGNGTIVPVSTRLLSNLGARETLDQFFQLCDAGDCAFGPHSAARFAALAARLKVHPLRLTLPDGSTQRLDYTNLIGATLGAMYDSAGWPFFAQFLAGVESQVSSSKLGAAYARLRFRPVYMAHVGLADYQNPFESFAGVLCEDSVNPSSYDAWWSAAATSAGYFGPIWTWASSICAVWPFKDAGRYLGPFNHHTANPLLVIGNLYDPATRYAGALKLAALMPGSRLLTLHGWGHTSLLRSQCIDQRMANYLIDVQLPPPGTVCQQDHIPFTH